MGNRVNIDTNKLHPWLQYKLKKLLAECEKQNKCIIITCGYRSAAEQDALYAQGRTKPGTIVTKAKGGHSQHNWGIAIDIAMNYDVDKDGKVTDDTWNKKGFAAVSKLAKKFGLGWGGDWHTIKDDPHLYMTKWGDTPTKLINTYGSFAKFKATWTGTVKCNTYLRKHKAFNNEVILTIPKGKSVKICYKSKLGYTFVKYGDKFGFIRSKNLK